MATYAQYSTGLANGHTLYLEISRNSSNNSLNWSKYSAKLRIIDSGGSYMIANANRNMGLNGSTINSVNNTYDTRNDTVFDWQGDVQVNHDVNGNASFNCFANWSTTYTGVGTTGNGSISQTFTADRLPLAPTISSRTSSNITPVSATIASTISSNGHGTSTTLTYYYRVNGVGSYINAGTGASRNLTGLTPNTTYQWYVVATNNNGDATTSSVLTFTTLSGVKMITSGGGTVDRVVKQILPSGVTTTRIVTKIT